MAASPELQRKIEVLYRSALEVDPPKRASFLDRACAGDDLLRQGIEALLSAPSEASAAIAPPSVNDGSEPKSDTGAIVGQTIAHYKILSFLGRGAMGEVYFAKDTKLGRNVALKVLLPELTLDSGRLDRFKQEARAASSLNHPNIVTIFEIGQAESLHYIVTEFIDGMTLRRYLSEHQIGIREMLDVATQIAGALSAAHAFGVVHRDIKPENIMRRKDGYVKVLDFGLAKLVPTQHQEVDESTQSTALNIDTDPGSIIGTVAYMSPEQLRGLKVDGRADVWSLGVVMYEMIAGRLPFGTDSKSDTIAAILREEVPLSTRYSEVPVDLQRIITKCLRKDREERYQSVNNLLIDLRDFKEDLELEARVHRGTRRSFQTEIVSDRALDDAISEAKTERIDTNKVRQERPTSGVEYFFSEIKHHPIGLTTAVALGLLIVVSIGLWFGFLRPSRKAARTANGPPQLSELITTSNVKEAAISPDGKYIAMVVEDAGKQNIRIRQSGSASESSLVSGNSEYRGLTFSPDGYSVYYLAKEDKEPALYQVSVLGGAPRKLIDDVITPVSPSPDGAQLSFVRRKGDRTLLMIAMADSGAERELATMKGESEFGTFVTINDGPAWSPDGKVIACSSMTTGDPFQMNIVSVLVADGSISPIGSMHWFLIGQLAWLGDGSGLIMEAQVKRPPLSTPQVWSVSYPGGETRTLTNDASYYNGISVTADSSTLITTRSLTTSEVWLVTGSPNEQPQEMPASKNKGMSGLTWTAEGQIIYSSPESGTPEIWTMNADGSNPRELTFDRHTNVEPAVCQYGSGDVVLASYGTGQSHIWRMNRNGGNIKQLTSGRYEDWPDCSTDGRWVIYHSEESGGVDRLWKIPVEGGQPVALTEQPGRHPVFSPDGRMIACFLRTAESVWRLAILPAEGGAPLSGFDIPASVADQWYGPRWTADGQAITYVQTIGGISNIRIQPLSGGASRQFTNFSEERIFAFAWSPDGRKLACARGSNTKSIVLIKNVGNN